MKLRHRPARLAPAQAVLREAIKAAVNPPGRAVRARSRVVFFWGGA